MEFPFTIVVSNEGETSQIAREFANSVKSGDTVALIGDLGTGKTFFVKRVANEFDYSEANSPTFAIVNIYSGRIILNHFDFYRIKKLEELYDLGFEEYLMNSSSITFIEWADMFPEILPRRRFEITIKTIGGTKREIKIEKL